MTRTMALRELEKCQKTLEELQLRSDFTMSQMQPFCAKQSESYEDGFYRYIPPKEDACDVLTPNTDRKVPTSKKSCRLYLKIPNWTGDFMNKIDSLSNSIKRKNKT